LFKYKNSRDYSQEPLLIIFFVFAEAEDEGEITGKDKKEDELQPEEGGPVGDLSRAGEESRADINSQEDSRHDPNLAGGASALSVNNSKAPKVKILRIYDNFNYLELFYYLLRLLQK
jgi:hypothetical protein